MGIGVIDMDIHVLLDAANQYSNANHLSQYRGRTKGVLMAEVRRSAGRVCDHPFFDMRRGKGPVAAEMDRLRVGRGRAV